MEQPTPVQKHMGLMAAVDELFDNVESSVTLQDGRTVEIYPAKFKHLRAITEFIGEFVSNFEEAELVQLISKVSKRQEDAINDGTSPYLTNTADMVKELTGDASLLLQIVARGLEVLPKYAELFTNMKKEEFEELDLDEAALIAFGIFGRNYHFFTQQALPVIQGSIGRLMSMSPKKKPQSNSPEKKSTTSKSK